VRRVDRSLQVAAHTRIDHGEKSCRYPHRRHTARGICAYAGESYCQTKSEGGKALKRVRMAAVYAICPHPPLHNPNTFPEFTECTSSPLKKDGIGIDSHNSGVAWPADLANIKPSWSHNNANSKKTRKRRTWWPETHLNLSEEGM